MSHTHQDGHGRCGACGDAGEIRRDREASWHKADDDLLPDELEDVSYDESEIRVWWKMFVIVWGFIGLAYRIEQTTGAKVLDMETNS